MEKKYYGIISVVISALLIIAAFAASYAYFSATITGNDEAKKLEIKTANLGLSYNENNNITLSNAIPGDTASKEFTVTNSSEVEATYTIYFSEVVNEFTRPQDITYTLSCSSTYDGSTSSCNTASGYGFIVTNKTQLPQVSSAINTDGKIKIKSGEVQTYTLTMEYKYEAEIPQNVDQGKRFSSRIQLDGKTDMIKFRVTEGALSTYDDYAPSGSNWEKYMQNSENINTGVSNLQIDGDYIKGKYKISEGNIGYTYLIDEDTGARVKKETLFVPGSGSIKNYYVGYNASLADNTCSFNSVINCALLEQFSVQIPNHGTVSAFAEFGMTWNEWLSSAYATTYVAIIQPDDDSEYLYYNESGTEAYIIDSANQRVKKTDNIKHGATYGVETN